MSKVHNALYSFYSHKITNQFYRLHQYSFSPLGRKTYRVGGEGNAFQLHLLFNRKIKGDVS